VLALLFSGAIFGFFYAWVCSTMWGLDAAPPKVAIEAMQAMNASVRNGVFAPAFFGTPFVLAAVGLWARLEGFRAAFWFFLLAAAVYFCGGLLLTMLMNVPMNEALALVEVPSDTQRAQEIWSEYSGPWQVWNITRTLLSGLSLMLVGAGLLALGGSGGKKAS
jgi:uncharacterized membrane protein